MPQRRQWFPGYTVAAVATVAYMATAPGQTFVVSQINTPVREEFGVSELALNSAYTIATVAAAFPLVIIGTLTDRLGPRRTLALVAVLFGLGCLVLGWAPTFAVVCVGFFLVRFLGQGALTMVCQHAVAMWFHRRLGTLNGIKQVVVFGAWAVFPQIAVRLIEAVGWRWTYTVFALLIWLAVIPAALLFVRDKPEDMGLSLDNDAPEPGTGPAPGFQTETGSARAPSASEEDSAPKQWPPAPEFTLKQARGTRAYWSIVVTTLPPPLIGTAFLFDAQPILAMRGMGPQDAANAVSAWTLTVAIMALPSGWLTDRVHASALLAGGTLVMALAVVAFWLAETPLVAIGGMALYGVGFSTIASCAAATTARYFGRSGHGAIRSSIIRLSVIATGLGPLVTALSVHFTGAYDAAMIFFLALCAPAVAMCVRLRKPVRSGI